jgi:hypothetical protein
MVFACKDSISVDVERCVLVKVPLLQCTRKNADAITVDTTAAVSFVVCFRCYTSHAVTSRTFKISLQHQCQYHIYVDSMHVPHHG